MKILVPVKRVVDPYVTIRVTGDGIDTSNVKMSMNPFDEIAVEEALRLREGGTADEVVAISLGDTRCQETIRTALAMGVDRGILVTCENELQPLAVAKVLAAMNRREDAMLVIMGKQAIDDDCGQTGQMLAALLGWAQATFVSKLSVADGRAVATREVDSGLETIAAALPVVVTTDLRLNEPRYASLPNIMKARRKPIATLTPEELAVDATPRLQTLGIEEPPARASGTLVSSVEELVDKLRNVEGVI